MTKQTLANPPVTLTPEALQQVIAEAIAKHEASKAEKARTDTSADVDKACVRAFRKAGFDDVKPRVNCLTYDKWVKEGRRVKASEKGIRVRNFRLFHITQTETISAQEAKKYLEEKEARKAAKSSSSDLLPKVTPIGTAKPKGKPSIQPSA
jgi:alpha-galactosidase/6-phospho-beta-glucosidase family protein